MKKIITIISILLISSCGFKVINLSNEDFSIVQINTVGDKRVNYLIRNNFLIGSDSNKKEIIININTNKNKTIKEKNIKNEITKYNISISAAVNVQNLINGKELNFNVVETGIYNVGTQNSVTRNNEKKLISLLADELAYEILLEIKIKSNDLDKKINILDLIILSKLENSKSEIRRLIKGNAIKINNQIISDEKLIIDKKLFDKNYLKLSIGKKRHIKVEMY